MSEALNSILYYVWYSLMCWGALCLLIIVCIIAMSFLIRIDVTEYESYTDSYGEDDSD